MSPHNELIIESISISDSEECPDVKGLRCLEIAFKLRIHSKYTN